MVEEYYLKKIINLINVKSFSKKVLKFILKILLFVTLSFTIYIIIDVIGWVLIDDEGYVDGFQTISIIICYLIVYYFHFKEELIDEKVESWIVEDEKVINHTKSLLFQKIWDKNDNELIKLFYFILNEKPEDFGTIEVIKERVNCYDNEHSHFIKIRDYDWYGIKISDVQFNGSNPTIYYFRPDLNKIQYDGNISLKKMYDGTGTIFELNKQSKQRIEWIEKYVDKEDFGISDYFKKEKSKVNTKKKNVSSFFNKNKLNIEGKDFELLLKKYETKIIEVDRTYIKQFVKVSNYLKTKKNNIQKIYERINKISNVKDMELYEGFLKNEIHLFNLLLFNSLNMIISLTEDEMIKFYEIYDLFDKLNVFDSTWEIEVSNKLVNIGNKLNELIYSINDMNSNLTNQLRELTLENKKTNRVLNKELQSINSNIDSGNLLSLISTYQLYKINKQTKGLIE